MKLVAIANILLIPNTLIDIIRISNLYCWGNKAPKHNTIVNVDNTIVIKKKQVIASLYLLSFFIAYYIKVIQHYITTLC